LVGGRWLVEDGHHVAEHAVLARYRAALAEATAWQAAEKRSCLPSHFDKLSVKVSIVDKLTSP